MSKSFNNAIVKVSNSDNHDQAIREWSNIKLYRSDIDHCICGKYIVNRFAVIHYDTNDIIIIGPECVKNFFPEILKRKYNVIRDILKFRNKKCIMSGFIYKKKFIDIYNNVAHRHWVDNNWSKTNTTWNEQKNINRLQLVLFIKVMNGATFDEFEQLYDEYVSIYENVIIKRFKIYKN